MATCAWMMGGALAWLAASLGYACWPPQQEKTADLLEQQLQRRLQSIPLPPDHPRHHQFKQYYLDMYALQVKELAPTAAFTCDWTAFFNCLGLGVMCMAAILAVGEYNFGTISCWMENAEARCQDAKEEVSKWRQRLENRRVERLIQEIGECESKTASGKRNCRRQDASDRKKQALVVKDKDTKAKDTAEAKDKLLAASSSGDAEPEAKKGEDREPRCAKVPAATKANPASVPTGATQLPAKEEPKRGAVLPEPSHEGTGAVVAGDRSDASPGRGKLRRRLEAQISAPRPAQLIAQERPVPQALPTQKVGSELLKEAEELLSQLEAEDLLRQLETEEAKKLRAADRRKAKKKRKGQGRTAATEPGEQVVGAEGQQSGEPDSESEAESARLQLQDAKASSVKSDDSASTATPVPALRASSASTTSDLRSEDGAHACLQDSDQEMYPALGLTEVSLRRRRRWQRDEPKQAQAPSARAPSQTQGPRPCESASKSGNRWQQPPRNSNPDRAPGANTPTSRGRERRDGDSSKRQEVLHQASAQPKVSSGAPGGTEGVFAGQALLKMLQGSAPPRLRADAPEFVPSAAYGVECSYPSEHPGESFGEEFTGDYHQYLAENFGEGFCHDFDMGDRENFDHFGYGEEHFYVAPSGHYGDSLSTRDLKADLGDAFSESCPDFPQKPSADLASAFGGDARKSSGIGELINKTLSGMFGQGADETSTSEGKGLGESFDEKIGESLLPSDLLCE